MLKLKPTVKVKFRCVCIRDRVRESYYKPFITTLEVIMTYLWKRYILCENVYCCDLNSTIVCMSVRAACVVAHLRRYVHRHACVRACLRTHVRWKSTRPYICVYVSAFLVRARLLVFPFGHEMLLICRLRIIYVTITFNLLWNWTISQIMQSCHIRPSWCFFIFIDNKWFDKIIT